MMWFKPSGSRLVPHVNLLKLSVGTDGVDDLEAWQRQPRARTNDGRPRHVTRMWPRRAAEVTGGGSIYWVIRGVILARQRILALEEVDLGDGIVRCGLTLDDTLHRTEAVLRRPFQGWRYLEPDDTPRDLRAGPADDGLPPALLAALADIGVR
jgi:hypothetical protein